MRLMLRFDGGRMSEPSEGLGDDSGRRDDYLPFVIVPVELDPTVVAASSDLDLILRL